MNERDLPAITLCDARPLLERIDRLEAEVRELKTQVDGVPNQLLTEKEARDYLRVGRDKLSELRRSGAIAYTPHAGRQPCYRRRDLDAFIERETVRPRRLRAAG